MKKFGAVIFLFVALSLADGGKLFEDKSLTELESLLADYKREKELDTKQHHFESKASFDGLSDEDKPRNPNRLNLEQLGTREFDLPQKKSSITPERNTKRRLEDFKTVVRKEKLTDEIRDAKEKKEVEEKKAQDSEGLGSIMRDESKPRIPSKLEKLDASDTALPAKRTSLKSELNPKHQLADFKRVAKKEEELTREIPDAKEKKEAKEKKAEDPEDLGVIMRDEKKPKISSKLDKSDTALPAKRTSLASEPRAAHKLADFKRVAKKEKESAKEKHENKEKPKDKTPGIVVKPKPFENAEELEEQAQKVMKFLESHPCPSPEESYYNITVYTADKLLAGTNSKVYIDLYGDLFNQRQSAGKIRLTNGGNSKEFDRGGVDSFTIKATFVGIVKRITIEHDNSGFFPDWDLVKIVVNDLKLGTTHTFACDCELSGYDNTKILPPV